MPLWNATLECHFGDPGFSRTIPPGWAGGSHGPYRLGGPGVLMDHTAWVDPNVPRADREWWCAECVQNADRVRFTGLPNPPLGLLA